MPSSKPAVIVIDLQTGMMDGVQFPPLYEHERLLTNARALIDWARRTHAPLAFVRHDGDPDDALAPGKPGWPIHPAVAPGPDEPTFSKAVGDSFAPGELEPWLRARDVESVILLGAQTDQCVNATLHGALSRGFSVTVAGDAHSTCDYAGETAAQIIARHNTAFTQAGATVTDTQHLVAR